VQQYEQILSITSSLPAQTLQKLAEALPSVQKPKPSLNQIAHLESRPVLTLSERQAQQKLVIKEKMTPQIYAKVIKILQMHKRRNSDGEQIYEDLKTVTK
jgi:hypothetical protein